LSNGRSFKYMFDTASTFNQDITNWNVAKGNVFSFMFKEATSFNQDIAQWDVSTGTEFVSMFHKASSFQQNLTSWPYSATESDDFCNGASCTSSTPNASSSATCSRFLIQLFSYFLCTSCIVRLL